MKRGLNCENYKRKLLFLMAIVHTALPSISELLLSLNVANVKAQIKFLRKLLVIITSGKSEVYNSNFILAQIYIYADLSPSLGAFS